jgi:hypothetical protein
VIGERRRLSLMTGLSGQAASECGWVSEDREVSPVSAALCFENDFAVLQPTAAYSPFVWMAHRTGCLICFEVEDFVQQSPLPFPKSGVLCCDCA